MDYINLISNVGFPISITLWFMLRTEKVINANTEALISFVECQNRK